MAPPTATATQPPPSRTAARSRHTILVVDDEPDVVKSVKDLLRLEYRVLGATSPEEGLRLMRQEQVHIVMTDQRMPGMSGVELLKQVRGDHPDATRLLFTGYADIRAVIDAINEGNVYRYITKPWDPDELQGIIREACERYDLIVERKQLLQMLQQQNKELETTNTELQRANELKYAFIQVASHELRTPLTILQGLTKLANQMPGVEEPLKDFMGRIEKAGRRLQHLVDQILAMLVAGRFERPLDRKPEDMAALLHEAAEDVRPFIELRQQVLDVSVPADLGRMNVEGARIRDSVNHLLLNAIKFTPDGGRIALSARKLGRGGRDVLEITVSDNGVGIDAAHRERLFEPFFTGFDVSRHSSGTFEHGRRGLGLGLSLVKAFIEMHGGAVAVESEAGKGTTFTLTLPIEQESSALSDATSTTSAPAPTA
jgi:signal transduction histidine kinase